MANSQRDEVVNLVFQQTGSEDLAKISGNLVDITNAGGPAAQQAQALVEQITKLGEVANQAAGLPALKAQLQSTGDELFLANQHAADLGATLAATTEPTAAQTRELQKAQQAAAALETQQTQLIVAIKASENAIAAQGLSTENLDATQRELQGSLASTAAEAKAFTASLNEAAVAGEREALTMSEIAERNAVLRTGFEQLKTVLGTIAGIIAFEKIKQDIGEVLDTGDKFAKWGAEFAAAFGSSQAAEDALAKVKQIADETPLSLDQVTQAALQAKKEGLDPFDGSLQAIIATSLQYGGNADTVSSLITALGRSANEGGLSVRTLTTLQQQGIPVAQLLGAAMGKTSDQITELAKQGKLGADSVSTLITALGNQNSGALASQMQLLGTQVTKVKDDYDEFLELIAKSGAYDFVVGKLQDLNAAFKQGLEDGSLQASAKAISDDLIALGNALISVTKFTIDHGDAIKTVAEAYALFKVSKLAADLLLMAGNLATNTAETLRNAAAAQADAAAQVELAAAIKAASVAAGESNIALDAASKGGILKALQSFTSLRGALNGVGSSLSGLVGGPIPAFIAAISFAAVETYNAINAEIAWGKQSLELIAQQRELAQTQTDLVAKAKAVEEQTKASANTQIASVEQLAAKNREQSAAYIQSLQDAIRHYTAIQIIDKAVGDSKGAQEAGDKVKAYSLALQDATGHQKDLSDSIDETTGKVGSVVDRFDDLQARGKTAATAVTGAFDGIDIGTPKGLTETVDILRQISARGKDAADAVSGELETALSKLDAANLSDVQKNLLDLFAQGKVSAQQLDIFLNATLQTSLKSIGLSAEQSGASFTDAGKKIIADFTNISSNARSTGDQIQLAFATGLSKLSAGGEVEALKSQLQDAFNGGLISAQQLQSGMDAAGRKIADLQVAAIEAGAGLDGMGTVGQTSSQKIVLALEDARDKVASQAKQIAADITAALAAGSDPTTLKANLKAAEAEIATFDTKIKTASESGDKGFKATAASARDAQQATTDAGDAAADASKQYDGFADTGEEGFADLTQAMANTRTEFLKISDAAAAFYDQSLKGNFELTTESDDAGAGFQRTAEAMAAAAKETTDQIAAQRLQVQGEIADINNLGTSSAGGFGQFGDNADVAIAKMRALSTDIQNGTYDAGLLGQADLAPLQQALDAAIQRTQQLADAAQQAKDQFTSLGDQLQDDLDEAAGNDTAVEDRRYQKQLADLKAAAQAAGQLSSAQYAQDVTNANALHQLKLKQIQQQQAAQNGTGGGPIPTSGGSGIGGGSGGGSSGGAGFGGLQQVHIHINGQQQDGTMLVDEVGRALLVRILQDKANSI